MHIVQPVEHLIEIDGLITVYNFARPKGFYFPGESHDFWECVYIREGEVTATADERVYQLGPGKLLVHKPMEFHRIWSKKDCAPWLINISFQAHGPLTEKLAGSCFDLRNEQQVQLFEIVNTFSKISVARDSQHTEEYKAFINLAAVQLEALLLTIANSDLHNAPSQAPRDEQFSRIVQVMKTNCHKNLTQTDLAELCQMSVSNMKRVFHQYSDVGIAKYFLTLRMRYAMELLENGTPANQVAEILNFPDPPYFYTVFKRETGVTPTQYRKQKTFDKRPV